MPRVYKRKKPIKKSIEKPVEKPIEKPIEKPVEKPVEIPEKKTIAELVNSTGNVIFSFSKEKNGYNWVELSMNIAKKKGLEVRFK